MMRTPELVTTCCGVEIEGGSCLFGCTAVADPDTGVCPCCREHSCNVYECPACGEVYEQRGGTWVAVA